MMWASSREMFPTGYGPFFARSVLKSSRSTFAMNPALQVVLVKLCAGSERTFVFGSAPANTQHACTGAQILHQARRDAMLEQLKGPKNPASQLFAAKMRQTALSQQDEFLAILQQHRRDMVAVLDTYISQHA
jgi:hypothetical protein